MQPHSMIMIEEIIPTGCETIPTETYKVGGRVPQVGHWGLACLPYFAQRTKKVKGSWKIRDASNPC